MNDINHNKLWNHNFCTLFENSSTYLLTLLWHRVIQGLQAASMCLACKNLERNHGYVRCLMLQVLPCLPYILNWSTGSCIFVSKMKSQKPLHKSYHFYNLFFPWYNVNFWLVRPSHSDVCRLWYSVHNTLMMNVVKNRYNNSAKTSFAQIFQLHRTHPYFVESLIA